MKLNRKIIIPAATLLIGLALAGSATSTIAWYQYSTRTNVAYIGTSTGTKGNLQVRVKKDGLGAEDGWTTNLGYDEIGTFLNNKKIAPITTGGFEKDAALDKFYSNPIAGFGPINKWKEAVAANYVQIPLQFRFAKQDGTKEGENYKIVQEEHDVYLTDLVILNDYTNAANTKRDLSSAIRVHFSNATESIYRLASKTGADTATTGNLDLDGDGKLDKDYSQDTTGAQYGFGANPDNQGTLINYGAGGGDTQEAYSAAGLVADDAKSKLGSTSATTGTYLEITVTIWIEGWQQLGKTSDSDTNLSSVWDYVSTIDSKFDVGMQFAAKTAE